MGFQEAILEAKDFFTLPLEELLGSLRTHEMGLNEYDEEGSRLDRRRSG